MRAFERLAGFVARVERLETALEHAIESVRQCVRVLERAKLDVPTCSVMLVGKSTSARADPICAAWTGALEPYTAVFEASGVRIWRKQGLIRMPRAVADGAVLCSVNGAMFRSVIVGDEEQFTNFDACGPVCMLKAIQVGLDVRFTLELKQ